jgi:DNA invertase Pin-like site-specific DNA recombinase
VDRVSTQDQNLDLQCGALTKSGCEKVFTDVISGIKEDRTGLQEALAFMRRGDFPQVLGEYFFVFSVPRPVV